MTQKVELNFGDVCPVCHKTAELDEAYDLLLSCGCGYGCVDSIWPDRKEDDEEELA